MGTKKKTPTKGPRAARRRLAERLARRYALLTERRHAPSPRPARRSRRRPPPPRRLRYHMCASSLSSLSPRFRSSPPRPPRVRPSLRLPRGGGVVAEHVERPRDGRRHPPADVHGGAADLRFALDPRPFSVNLPGYTATASASCITLFFSARSASVVAERLGLALTSMSHGFMDSSTRRSYP